MCVYQHSLTYQTSLQMPSFPEVLYNMNFASVLITEPDTTSNNVTAQSILAANVPRKIKISNKGGPKANAVKIKNENQLKSCTYAQLVEELVQCFKIGANEFRFMELQCKEFSGIALKMRFN